MSLEWKVNGTVFWACGYRNYYVSVPDIYFATRSKRRFDPLGIDYRAFEKEVYASSLWPEINARANRCADGTYLFPDLHRPVADHEATTRKFKNFVRRLQKAFHAA